MKGDRVGLLDSIEAMMRAERAGHDGPVEFRKAAIASVSGALHRWCDGIDAEPAKTFRVTREWPGGEDGMTYYILGIEFTTGGDRFAGEVYYRGDQDYGTLNAWPAPPARTVSASDDTWVGPAR